MIYYISDLHFGHRNVIEMDGRPFETVEQMDEALIRLWNERVTDEDDVYILGDFAYRNGNTASWYLRQLKGRKHLIIGNHDRVTVQDEKALEHFVSVEKIDRVLDNDRKVSLCHFPIAEWNGKRYGGYHVHGHLHNRREEVYEFMSRFDRALNAGCMINGYRPVTLEELIENNLRFRREAETEQREEMRIQICSIKRLYQFLDEVNSGRNVAIISSATEINAAKLSCIPYVFRQYEDLDCEYPGRSFSQADAEAFAHFVRKLDESIDTLYCCCDAGESRSPAVAAAVMRYFGMDDLPVWRNPHYHPNMLVFATLSKALGVAASDEEMDFRFYINQKAFADATGRE